MNEELLKLLEQLEQEAHSTAISTRNVHISFGDCYIMLPVDSVVYRYLKGMTEELINDSETDIC